MKHATCQKVLLSLQTTDRWETFACLCIYEFAHLNFSNSILRTLEKYNKIKDSQVLCNPPFVWLSQPDSIPCHEELLLPWISWVLIITQDQYAFSQSSGPYHINTNIWTQDSWFLHFSLHHLKNMISQMELDQSSNDGVDDHDNYIVIHEMLFYNFFYFNSSSSDGSTTDINHKINHRSLWQHFNHAWCQMMKQRTKEWCSKLCYIRVEHCSWYAICQTKISKTKYFNFIKGTIFSTNHQQQVVGKDNWFFVKGNNECIWPRLSKTN